MSSSDHPSSLTGLPSAAADVLDFWFGPNDSQLYRTIRPEWFKKDDTFDELIRERFGSLVERALIGGGHASANALRDWTAPPAMLARIVLLDQFTRNVFRNTARAFAGDAQALSLARAMVALKNDRALPPIQRSFVYLPFEHSETMADQDESVRLFSQVALEAEQTAVAEQALAFRSNLDYAHRHRAVIARFGRFPHRNVILGRTSTAEEVEFLKQPGSGF
ncbi:MAG: rane protein [Rhizobacter sp.]|nr:rane protein [Rhizobacter sp.]